MNQDPFAPAGSLPLVAPALAVPDVVVPDVVVPVLVGLALVVLALTVLALAVALRRARTQATVEREDARAEAAALRTRLEDVERRLAASADEPRGSRPAAPEFVITHVGEEDTAARHVAADGAPARVPPALFADLVLREGVVRVASLASGVRAALAPETRHRIRFEVRREVRRARKQRRADTRLARRELASRQRAAMTDDEDAA